jgi:hypothetical protein
VSWLYLTLPLAVLLSVWHPRVWVALDLHRIQANGSDDTLGRTWHRHRFSWRLAVALVIAVLAALPIAPTGFPAVVLASAVLIWQGAWWTYDFNTRLNVARNLPYVDKYHVSWSPNAAAFPDRWLWQRALRQAPHYATRPLVSEIAAGLLRELLFWVLLGGGVLAMGLAGVAVWLAQR